MLQGEQGRECQRSLSWSCIHRASLPPGAKLLLERAGLSPRAPHPHLLRLVESCKVGGPLACVSALGGWAA